MWDVQSPSSEAEDPSSPTKAMRKTGSQASLQAAGWQGAQSGPQGGAAGDGSGKSPTAAAAAAAGGKPSFPGVSPSPHRAEMLLYEPLMEHRLHQVWMYLVMVGRKWI